MSEPVVFLPLLFVVGALLFWAWMFRDLWANSGLPIESPSGITWPPDSKNAWTIFFIVLNVFGALFYYFRVYRERA